LLQAAKNILNVCNLKKTIKKSIFLSQGLGASDIVAAGMHNQF
jgi:hypothetical protein